jgi:hypothetical protein
MLYAGLDLSRKRLDFHLLDSEGATVEVGAAAPDANGLLALTRRLDRHREPIRAAIESMNGARFVHDRLELVGAHCQTQLARVLASSSGATWRRKSDRVLGHPRAQAVPLHLLRRWRSVTECEHDVRPNPHANRLRELKTPDSPRTRIDRM